MPRIHPCREPSPHGELSVSGDWIANRTRTTDQRGVDVVMEVTKVTLRPVSMNKVCAIASVVLDGAFVIHDLRVVNGEKGLFVAMPSRKLPNGDFRDICHPINAEARQQLQDAVLEQFTRDGGVEYFTSPEALAAHEPVPAFD
jgi:stage V sporulation protein G